MSSEKDSPFPQFGSPDQVRQMLVNMVNAAKAKADIDRWEAALEAFDNQYGNDIAGFDPSRHEGHRGSNE